MNYAFLMRDSFALWPISNSTLWLYAGELQLFFPELSLLLGLSAILFFGIVYSTHKEIRYPALLQTRSLHTVRLFFGTLYIINIQPRYAGSLWNGNFTSNPEIIWGKEVILLLGAILILISRNYFKKVSMVLFEYVIRLGFSIFGIMRILSAGTSLAFYRALELQSFCFYIITALKRTSSQSTEAALKYFLLGAISSGIILLGASLIYGTTGSASFSTYAILFLAPFQTTEWYLFVFEAGCALFRIGFFFKRAAAPFHVWSPDVYQGAPTYVTAVFATLPKRARLLLLWRLRSTAFLPRQSIWIPGLQSLALVSLCVGVFSAISQKNRKRFFAYSSISHMGFFRLGIVCLSGEAYTFTVLYLIIYVVMGLCFFALLFNCPVAFSHKVPFFFKTQNRSETTYIHDLVNLSNTNKLISFLWAILLFSIAGIPPLAGFYSKAFLIWVGVHYGQYILSFFCILSTRVSAFYYLRIIRRMFFGSTPQSWVATSPVSTGAAWIIVGLLFFLVGFTVNPSLIFSQLV